MARTAAAKKVARAASTGAGGKGIKLNRSWTFPVAMAAVVLIGVLLVVFARGERSDILRAENPDWWLDYSFFHCDEFTDDWNVPPGQPLTDTGVRAHGDSLIQVRPASQSAQNAPFLWHFFAVNGGSIDDRSVSLPPIDEDAEEGSPEAERRSLSEFENMCPHPTDPEGSEGAELRVLRWNRHDAPAPVVFTEGLNDVRLAGNGQLVTVAFVHPDFDNDDIGAPDATELLAWLEAGDAPEQGPAPPTTAPPTTVTSTTAPPTTVTSTTAPPTTQG